MTESPYQKRRRIGEARAQNRASTRRRGVRCSAPG